jgi:GGDEF domain-containing protein
MRFGHPSKKSYRREQAKDLALTFFEHPSDRSNMCGNTGSQRRQERLVYELMEVLGNSLNLHETMSDLETRLGELILFDAMALWLPCGRRLFPGYANGEDARVLCSLELPFGSGVSGAAAESRSATAGSEESGYQGTLRSAMAAPLESRGELTGVLTLYRRAPKPFRQQELAVLQRVRKKTAAAVQNAVKYERAERLAVVDPATSLPNQRALFLRLDAELARCRRTGATLAVLVCEIEPAGRGVPQCEALPAVAADLRALCREEDCVARMGNGFVLVLGGFGPQHFADKEKQIEAIAAARSLVARVGAAFYPQDGSYAEDLLAAADGRMRGRAARPNSHVAC